MADPEQVQEEEEQQQGIEAISSSAHDITSLSDLPGKRMKTKLWPMSPIQSLTADEVLAIAKRDQTPVLIAVMEGDESGERYLCSNKRGVTLPPEVAAEGVWAQKYYQQVAVLNDSLKEMQESFLPVWELAKSQQALLVSVEVFDGLLAVANQGLQMLYKSWSIEDMKAIITRECDFRVYKQVHYYSLLKNYTLGRFGSLDQARLQAVEDLLLAGETYLLHHARTNGFYCPPDIRALFQEFLPLKRDRNEYSHPLTLARKRLASSVLQKLRTSVINDELDFIRGTKELILLGADYAESVLQSYGKVRQKLFLDPKRKKKRPRSNDSPEESPHHSPPYSPSSPQRQAHLPSYGQSFQLGQSSKDPFAQSPESPQAKTSPGSSQHALISRSPPLGSPLVLTYPHGSEILQRPTLSLQIPEASSPHQSPGFYKVLHQSPLLSPSLESCPTSPSSQCSQSTSGTQSTETPNPARRFKRPRL